MSLFFSHSPRVHVCALPVWLACELFAWHIKLLAIFTCIICVISLCIDMLVWKICDVGFILFHVHAIGDKSKTEEEKNIPMEFLHELFAMCVFFLSFFLLSFKEFTTCDRYTVMHTKTSTILMGKNAFQMKYTHTTKMTETNQAQTYSMRSNLLF